MECTSLSTFSLSGRWMLGEANRSNRITWLVLPVFAALDAAICLTLTCMIVPLCVLGKDHLKNTVGAICTLVRALFFIKPKFDCNRPYLLSGIPIDQMIANHKYYGKQLVQKLCHEADGNKVALFARWDVEFASKLYGQKLDYPKALLSFISSHKFIRDEHVGLAKKLLSLAKDYEDLLPKIIEMQAYEWIELNPQNKDWVQGLILNFQVFGEEIVKKQCQGMHALVGNRSEKTEKAFLFAKVSPNFAARFLRNEWPDFESALLEFSRLYPKSNNVLEKTTFKQLALLYNREWKKEGHSLFYHMFKKYRAEWLSNFLERYRIEDVEEITEQDVADLKSVNSSETIAIAELLSSRSAHFITHLHKAASECDMDALRWWIDVKTPISWLDGGKTALLCALQSQSPKKKESIEFLLREGANPNLGFTNSQRGYEISFLLAAILCRHQNEDVLASIIGKGAQFMSWDKDELEKQPEAFRQDLLVTLSKYKSRYENYRFLLKHIVFPLSEVEALLNQFVYKALGTYCEDPIVNQLCERGISLKIEGDFRENQALAFHFIGKQFWHVVAQLESQIQIKFGVESGNEINDAIKLEVQKWVWKAFLNEYGNLPILFPAGVYAIVLEYLLGNKPVISAHSIDLEKPILAIQAPAPAAQPPNPA